MGDQIIRVGCEVTGVIDKLDDTQEVITKRVMAIEVSSRNEPFLILEGMPNCLWLASRFKTEQQSRQNGKGKRHF